ncbi:MAG: hypothetical protein JWM95_4836 [Gemmatimonadetes bacterium]|nr:hypothetical protein [Gemmatimonadota bacterium]
MRTFHAVVSLMVPLTILVAAPARAQTTMTGPGVPLGSGCTGFSFVVHMANSPSGSSGAMFEFPTVGTVTPGSPAAAAGLLTNDVIVAVGDTPGDARGAMKWPGPGTKVAMKIRRASRDTIINIVTGEVVEAKVDLKYDAAAPVPSAPVAGLRKRCAPVTPAAPRS